MKEEVLYRYIKGETTAEENLHVAKWMEEEPASHQQKLDEVRFIYEFSMLYGDQIEHKAAAGRKTGLRAIQLRRIGGYVLRIAAAVILVVLGGNIARHRLYNTFTQQTNVLQVPYGQRIHITLADGSDVWLNSGARLEYPVVFEKKLRRVKLSGEGLFDVRHDENCPFEVETFATNISVLGTKFNVLADEAHERFSTTLLEGRVKIANRLDPRQREIIMNPDDIVNLSNGRLYVETLRDHEALCWTEGLVNISGLKFDELMSKFEQVFDVRIVIARRTLPDIGKISGKIRVNDGIENALHILQYAADFTYHKDDEANVVTIY